MPKKKFTKDELLRWRYQDLIKIMPKFGLKYQFQKKLEIIDMILSGGSAKSSGDIEDAQESVGKKSNSDIAMAKVESDGVLKKALADYSDGVITKSEACRRLYKGGLTIGDVSNVLKIHYSFAYCVIDKFKKLSK